MISTLLIRYKATVCYMEVRFLSDKALGHEEFGLKANCYIQ